MVTSHQQLEAAARRFLATGAAADTDLTALAEACNLLIRGETQKSARHAVRLAQKFVRQADSYGGRLLTTALRTRGWAQLVAGKYAAAKESYLKARSRLNRDPLARARIDRILVDVGMYLGDFAGSQRRARLALAAFQKLQAHEDAAKTRVNYGNLLHRQDRHREARKLYEQATRFFEKQGDTLSVALCYFNLANTLVQLFDFDKAALLYQKAQQYFRDHDCEIYAIDCLNGLAWLHLLEGDYHVALQELAECEAVYRTAAQPQRVVLCRLDRAEAYLGLNLFADARRAAQAAEKGARALEISYEAAKAAFFCAKASNAMGHRRPARMALRRAEKGFGRQGNEAFLAAAKLFAAQIDPKGKDAPTRIAQARDRFSQAQLPLWEAICDLQHLAVFGDEPEVLKRLAKNRAVSTVPHLLARQQTLLGDREARRGRVSRAVCHWTRAAEVLDAVRAKLPPIDMRSAYARHGCDPHLKLVRAEIERDATRAAVWSERRKTAGLWATARDVFHSHPARDRAEAGLAQLASQVTALAGRIGESTGRRGAPAAAASTRLDSLRAKVRHELAAVERMTDSRTDRFGRLVEMIKEVSVRQPVVQFHLSGHDMVAFIHYQGETRFQRYHDGGRAVREVAGHWRFLAGASLLSKNGPSRADLAEERALLKELGDWLWAPLELSSKRRRVLVLPEGALSNLPWQALVHKAEPLAARHQIVLAPSFRHYQHARRQRARSQEVEVFVGNTEGLDQAVGETETLARLTEDNITIHRPCRRQDWPNESRARLWHYAGHAQFRVDNPFYSSLQLTDGPLFAADFRLKSNTVGLVTLAACRTGQQTLLPGEESLGLVRSLLEMGARNVLASHWAIADAPTHRWMTVFYEYFFGGMPVAEAARQAALQISEEYPSAYHWAAFSIFGAG